ncbi:hypothetical protein AnigIFM49718_008597 [Aspergillus niger]|nr:hypothetical protein AnigIFM49718_008597 [Aspergillus niger]
MAVLNGAGSYSKQSITITPVYDRAAAVKYYTFDNDQWFSYDDGSTFAQKIAWANEVGLGGAMIWGSDLDAMANASGSGYTVVGWDDAGCGKKNCNCGKPVCCPTSSAAKDCIWRGDNTGDAGVSSNWNAQCQDGEINIAGIRSSWGGGFVNDGDTDKCGR